MNALDPKQIAEAQKIINSTPSGEFELKEIYGSRWSSVDKPTSFGKSFKATVTAGLFQNIRLKSLKTNNHHTYIVDNP